MKSYINNRGEKILVYPSGNKIRESLMLEQQEKRKADKEKRKIELRKLWLEFCAKYDLNPND